MARDRHGRHTGRRPGQLGTVGSGNHYVDLMRDEDGFVWIGVHFGSRGLGHTSATRYLKAAGGKDGMNVPPAVVDEDSELGRRYIAAMELAGRYSYAGPRMGGRARAPDHRRQRAPTWCTTTTITPGARPMTAGICWVVRKGATPAFPGQRGFVGGSMGDDAVILEGVDSPEAKSSLYSTVHGAGRLFGRKEAKRRFTEGRWTPGCSERGVNVDRRRPGREPDGLSAPAGGAGTARRDSEGLARLAPRLLWRWPAKVNSIRGRTRCRTRWYQAFRPAKFLQEDYAKLFVQVP